VRVAQIESVGNPAGPLACWTRSTRWRWVGLLHAGACGRRRRGD
jgi:hypothetical protein